MHPYLKQSPKAFWKSGVVDKSMYDAAEVWDPKFDIKPDDMIGTYGSCFSQHIGQALTDRGHSWLQTERAPFGMDKINRKRFGYDIFSSRTSNIYTTSLFYQWTEWSTGNRRTSDEIWEMKNRYFDPFRPNIEPNGFASEEEVRVARETTLKSFNTSIKKAKYLIFTMGLTERWLNRSTGVEYPMCPGTIRGEFDSNVHKFSNMDFDDIAENLSRAICNMHKINKGLKIILTVSPIPLAATATNSHVLVANTHSKSLLRSVAGQLAKGNSHIDYFPSYEIINNPASTGPFADNNLRSVTQLGVDAVMDSFFSAQERKFGKTYPKMNDQNKSVTDLPEASDDLACEEELLGTFGSLT